MIIDDNICDYIPSMVNYDNKWQIVSKMGIYDNV